MKPVARSEGRSGDPRAQLSHQVVSNYFHLHLMIHGEGYKINEINSIKKDKKTVSTENPDL